jgi:hypothetical protein
MLEICIQTSYDKNVQLILKSYLPVVYGTLLSKAFFVYLTSTRDSKTYMMYAKYIVNNNVNKR